MPSSFNHAAARGRLHRIALAGLVSIALAGTALIGTALIGTGGIAGAQESEDTSTTTTVVETAVPDESRSAQEDTEKPPSEPDESTATETAEPATPLTPFDVSVLTDCWPDGYGEVTVFLRIPENPDVEYSVRLHGHDAQRVRYDSDDGFYFTVFLDVAAGVHPVTVTGTDGTDIKVEANLESCQEGDERPSERLEVSVKCQDGLGVVTIQVYNPSTKKSRFLTIAIDDFGALPPYEHFEFFPDVVAKITEIAEDGTYEIKLLKREKLIDSETVTVACAVPSTTPTTTTTTPPPAQGGTAPPAGGLPTTGAAVGGIAVLGVIALLLGAVLVLAGRRRTTPEAPDA